MGTLKKAVFGLSVAFAALLLLELAFRIYDYRFKYRDRAYLGTQANVPFEEMQTFLFKTGKCVRDPSVIWRYNKLRGRLHKFNSRGLRTEDGIAEPAVVKPAGVFRIIVLGGSHPFGVGVGYTDTYAYQLGTLLSRESRRSVKEAEVINAAVPGYSTLQALNLLKFSMLDYRPDLLIVDAGNNDGIALTRDWPWSDSQVTRMSPFVCKAVSTLERSSFFWYYRTAINNIRGLLKKPSGADGAYAATRVSVSENRRNLEEIKDIARERNMKVLFLSQMRLDEHGNLQRGFGAVMEPSLDIYARLKNETDVAGLFVDPIHASRKGHRKIAEIIYDHLAAEGVTPD